MFEKPTLFFSICLLCALVMVCFFSSKARATIIFHDNHQQVPATASRSPLKRVKNLLAHTGIITSGGLVVGLPGLFGLCEVGYRHAMQGDPLGSGPFLTIGGYAYVTGGYKTFSTNPRLRGVEKYIGTISVGSPIYGDQVSVCVIPVALGIAASRKGGLGISTAAIPTPYYYPALRGSFKFYLTNPKLTGLSNKVLDTLEAYARQALRFTQPIVNGAKKLKQWSNTHLFQPLYKLSRRPFLKYPFRSGRRLSNRQGGQSLSQLHD